MRNINRDRKTVERSLMQFETLVESLRENSEGSSRMAHLFISRLSPSWQMEADLCQILMSVGSTKSALDLALKLRQWNDVISCYHQLQLRHKAAEVIRLIRQC